jgi:hypothetical protein
LRQIKKWQIAFRKGDFESIKDDVGAVAGSMAVQIGRLLDAVIKDGVVVVNEKPSPFGLYKEKMVHPDFQQAANICKTLGIDLASFLMTPRSAKEAGPQVHINIGVSADEVQARFAARYNKPRAPSEDVVDI